MEGGQGARQCGQAMEQHAWVETWGRLQQQVGPSFDGVEAEEDDIMWPEKRPENDQRGQGKGPYINRERD